MSLPPRPHPCARSKRVDRVNGWLETAWRKGLCNRPPLEPDMLWSKALRDAPAAGEQGPRSEADVADFRLRLEMLCKALETEAQLNPLGQTMAHGQLVRTIRQRMELGSLWLAEPELLETSLAPPVIVVGHMRSGTTRVHRLLACDPALSATRFCDSWLPVPRSPDTRPFWSALSLVAARTLDPWIDAIHPFGVTRPDEELGWLATALDHSSYEAQWRIPSFTAFSEARDPAPVYREFDRILRTDASWHGNADRPRVLKIPQFSEDLPALLARFPEARVVRTMRCHDETAASAASLIANQMAIQSDEVNFGWIEREAARKIALRQQRMDDALSRFPGPQAVVEFEALNKDWEGEIRRAYSLLGMQLSKEALAAMRHEQGRAKSSPHKQHGEQLREFSEKVA